MRVSAGITSVAPLWDSPGAPFTEHLRGQNTEAAAEGQRQAPLVAFTPRQREVLSLLGEGMPTKVICRRLNIAVGTAKAHISFIFRKLGTSSRLQAVVMAHRLGLLGEDGLARQRFPHPPG